MKSSVALTPLLFGYGSLINFESLKTTAPSATDIRPAYIKGFIRSFSVWDPVGWTETNLDLAGQPMCAVDIHKVTDPEARVNGIAFTVSHKDLTRLLRREQNYKLITTHLYNYETDQALGPGQVFLASKNDGTYDFEGAAQARYLQICLDSFKQYGERFYQEFLHSTFIDGRRLDEIPSLIL